MGECVGKLVEDVFVLFKWSVVIPCISEKNFIIIIIMIIIIIIIMITFIKM